MFNIVVILSKVKKKAGKRKVLCTQRMTKDFSINLFLANRNLHVCAASGIKNNLILSVLILLYGRI